MRFLVYIIKTIKYNFEYHKWRKRQIKRNKRIEWIEKFINDEEAEWRKRNE